MRCVLLLVMTSALSLAYAGEVPPSTGAPIAPATAPTGKAPSAQAPKPGEAPKPATTGEPTPPVPGAKDDGKGGPVDPTRGSPGPGGDAGGVGTKPGSHGMVVRLDTGVQKIETPVVVHLKPKAGAVAEVQLKDDGAPPDVLGADGVWSGTVWNENDEFTVSVSTGKTNVDGGPISWSKDDLQRDLSLTLLDGQLKAEASVATVVRPPDGSGAEGGAPGSGSPAGQPQPGTPTAAGGGGAPGGFQLDGPKPKGGAGATGSDATLYVAMGVCGFALAIIAHLYFRGGRSRPSSGGLPEGVTVVPEAGLFGPGTPSLSEGLSQWVVPPNDAHELLRPLIATLARYNRVVVCAPPRSALPSVPGGPVYRVEPGKPADLADAVIGVQEMGAGGVAVLMLGDGLDGAALKALGDALPEGVGGAVLVMQVLMTTLPVVHCERRGDVWHIKLPNAELDLTEAEDGFRPA